MISKKYNKAGTKCSVTFIVPPEQAHGFLEAHIVGDFNNWDTNAHPMGRTKQGGFEITLELESGKEYYFRYLFDGKIWDNDWNADKYVPSPFADSENSVVIV